MGLGCVNLGWSTVGINFPKPWSLQHGNPWETHSSISHVQTYSGDTLRSWSLSTHRLYLPSIPWLSLTLLLDKTYSSLKRTVGSLLLILQRFQKATSGLSDLSCMFTLCVLLITTKSPHKQEQQKDLHHRYKVEVIPDFVLRGTRQKRKRMKWSNGSYRTASSHRNMSQEVSYESDQVSV